MVVRLFLCLAGAKLAPFLEQSARNTQFIEIWVYSACRLPLCKCSCTHSWALGQPQAWRRQPQTWRHLDLWKNARMLVYAKISCFLCNSEWAFVHARTCAHMRCVNAFVQTHGACIKKKVFAGSNMLLYSTFGWREEDCRRLMWRGHVSSWEYVTWCVGQENLLQWRIAHAPCQLRELVNATQWDHLIPSSVHYHVALHRFACTKIRLQT